MSGIKKAKSCSSVGERGGVNSNDSLLDRLWYLLLLLFMFVMGVLTERVYEYESQGEAMGERCIDAMLDMICDMI
jgi:hypothetical protein